MNASERKVLQVIANQAGNSDFGAVNPAQLKKATGVTVETLNRAVVGLQKQGFIEIDEDAGTLTITDSGREALDESDVPTAGSRPH